MSGRPNCNRCQTPLTGPAPLDLTTCPSCGKRWLLTADHSQIAGTLLTVQSGQHGSQARQPGEKRNG